MSISEAQRNGLALQANATERTSPVEDLKRSIDALGEAMQNAANDMDKARDLIKLQRARIAVLERENAELREKCVEVN